MSRFSEDVVEQAVLAWLESVGWQVAHGPEIAPDMPAAERADYGEVVLARRLREALARRNRELPAEALAERLSRAEPLLRACGGPGIRRNPNWRTAEARTCDLPALSSASNRGPAPDRLVREGEHLRHPRRGE